MTNLILCGGNGTRLWPLSRTKMPKQFLQLFQGESLFQKTVRRNIPFCDHRIIVSNTDQYFLAMDQLEELGQTDVAYILEPIGRNTAPAIALACLAMDLDEILLVTPSDHLIKNELAYHQVLSRAQTLAKEGYLVTFGIQPQYAETGFGYIEAEGEEVCSFKEKPNTKTAQMYLDAGNYYWNSGMFCFQAGVFLEELQRYMPQMYDTVLFAYENAIKNRMIRIDLEDMLAIPEESIDYAVMEKSKKVKVVPADIEWSDLGSFEALDDELNYDTIDLTSIDAKNNMVLSDKKVVLIDVDDLIVIDTPDALLVSKKGSSQKVKEAVAKLKENGSELPDIHRTVYRPWGTYTVLEDTEGYKIKRIEVKPGKRLSLQKHFHRNEHWIVVSGTATVVVGNTTKLVRPNESTYIKMGEVHRLSNEGKIPVILIEAQVGEYTGEDDIVRLDDDYEREGK